MRSFQLTLSIAYWSILTHIVTAPNGCVITHTLCHTETIGECANWIRWRTHRCICHHYRSNCNDLTLSTRHSLLHTVCGTVWSISCAHCLCARYSCCCWRVTTTIAMLALITQWLWLSFLRYSLEPFRCFEHGILQLRRYTTHNSIKSDIAHMMQK